eukprot:3458217-Pyramimonas_sp.AAC.1
MLVGSALQRVDAALLLVKLGLEASVERVESGCDRRLNLALDGTGLFCHFALHGRQHLEQRVVIGGDGLGNRL